MVNQKITPFVLGLAMLIGGFFLVKNNTALFKFHNGYREDHPAVREFNPIGELDNPKLSKFVSILIGVVLMLLGGFFVFVSVFF